MKFDKCQAQFFWFSIPLPRFTFSPSLFLSLPPQTRLASESGRGSLRVQWPTLAATSGESLVFPYRFRFKSRLSRL